MITGGMGALPQPESSSMREVIGNRLYRREAAVEEILADLRRVGARVQRRELMRTFLLLGAYFALPVGGVLFVMSMEAHWDEAAVAVGIGSVLALVAFIVLRIISRRWALDVFRYQVCSDLIGALRLAPHARVRAEVNIAPLEHADNKTDGPGKAGKFHDVGLKLEGALPNGVEFSYSREEDLEVWFETRWTTTTTGGRTCYTKVTIKKSRWRFDDTLQLRSPIATQGDERFHAPRLTTTKAITRRDDLLAATGGCNWQDKPSTFTSSAVELFRNLHHLSDTKETIADERLISTGEVIFAEERHPRLTRRLAGALIVVMALASLGSLVGSGVIYLRAPTKIRAVDRSYGEILRSRGCTLTQGGMYNRCGLPSSCMSAISSAKAYYREHWRMAFLLLCFCVVTVIAGGVLLLKVRGRIRRGEPPSRLKPLVVTCVIWALSTMVLGTSFGLYCSANGRRHSVRTNRTAVRVAEERNDFSEAERREDIAVRQLSRANERSGFAMALAVPGLLLLPAGWVGIGWAVRRRKPKVGINQPRT